MTRATGLALTLGMLALASGHAAPLAEDDFESYATGSMDGGSGGRGFAAGWSGAGSSVESIVDVSTNPLEFTTAGGDTLTGGDRAIRFTGNSDRAIERSLDTSVDADSIYLGMLMRFDGTQNDNDFVALWIETPSWTTAPNFGLKMNRGNGSGPEDLFARARGSSEVYDIGITNGTTYFIVAKFWKSVPGAANPYDRATLYANPDDIEDEPVGGLVSSATTSITSFSTIGFRTVNLDADDSLEIAFIRIGTTWADVTPPVPLAEWLMEESSWSGAAGEVLDSSGHGYHGTATNGPTTAIESPAVAGSPGTCRYGVFDGSDDYVEIPGFPDLQTDFSLTAWIRSTTASGDQRIFVDDRNNSGGYAFSVGDGGTGEPRFFSRGVKPVILDGGADVAPDSWHHLAIVHDSHAKTRTIYVDGDVSVTESSAYSKSFGTDTGNAAIGGEVDGTSEGVPRWRFGGSIDDVRIFDLALTENQIEALLTLDRTCPAAAVAATLDVDHDGSGIYCAEESIGVTVRDSMNAVLTTYTEQITLDTQSGVGTWTLESGAGAFADAVADDGLATYTFAAEDAGTASFRLSIQSGTSIDVDAYQTSNVSIRDDDTEGVLALAPTGFTVTANALSNPPPSPISDPIGPQTAGTAFAIHFAAYGQTEDDPECGIIESYAGPKTLAFWSSHENPTSALVQASIGGSAIGTSEAAATDLAVTFTSGQASVGAKYKDVGQIRISAKDSTPADGEVRGGSAAFVVKPADLVVGSVTNSLGDANPGASTGSGAVFTAAGAAFTVEVSARDSEGSLTPSYGTETPAEGMTVEVASLVAPAGGSSGSIGSGSTFSAISPAGTFRNSALSFSEVGAITIRARVADADYLGAGDVAGTPSATVGRFTPSDFAVLYNIPLFATGCPTGGFTYMDQPFVFDSAPVMTVTARNAAGGTTTNYTGDFFRLTNASLAGRQYSSPHALVDQTGLPDASSDPTIVDLGTGQASLTFSSGTGLRFARVMPIAPFSAEISLELNVIDLDAIAHASNPAAYGPGRDGGTIDFDAGDQLRFGRLTLDNAHGSETSALAVPLYAEHWNGSGWVLNTDDSCTSIGLSHIALAPSPVSLSSTASLGYTPLLAGAAGLSLSPPGAGASGTIDLSIDLGVGGAGLPWLRFDWPSDGDVGGAPDEDPSCRATFGIYEGNTRVIFKREVY